MTDDDPLDHAHLRVCSQLIKHAVATALLTYEPGGKLTEGGRYAWLSQFLTDYPSTRSHLSVPPARPACLALNTQSLS